MKSWLEGIAAASVLSFFALMLTPPGRVRFVTRMVCGILCALAVVSPVLELDMDTLSVSLASYGQQARQITESAEEEAKMLERTYIEEECAAYILSKAGDAEVGSVSVSARWDDDAGVWYPWSAALDCAFHKGLSDRMVSDLGIPVERQVWAGEEGLTNG